jgi:hypothetical protein
MATYYEDFEDSRCRAALESAKLEKEIRLLVRQEENRLAPSIGATGKLNADGEFEVMPDTAQDSYSVPWAWVQQKLSEHR